MVWCLGIVVLLAWHSSFAMHNAAVSTSFLAAAIFWFFVGAGALITGLVRLVAGKIKPGVPSLVGGSRPGTPATLKGE
jgi:hypothetical protein